MVQLLHVLMELPSAHGQLPGARFPLRFQCTSWEQAPAAFSVLPTLLWVLCPACKHQASFSRDSLLACATVSPAFLITAIELFPLAVLRAAVHWAHPTAYDFSCLQLERQQAANLQAEGRNLAEGLGGSGTTARWHRAIWLWVLARRGDSLPLGFCHACCKGSATAGLAVLWWAVWQLQAGTWLTGGSLVGFRRVLQFGASKDVIRRFALSRHT